MNRFISAMKIDVIVQARTQLYTIGIVSSIAIAVALAQLFSPRHLTAIVPSAILLVIGGTTFLYIGALVIFEKDEGTLNAIIVSPVRPSEYLWAKIASLNLLATVETFVMIGGAMLLMMRTGKVAMPNLPLLLLGTVAVGIIYTLLGLVLIVRYKKVTDFMIPMAVVAMILQLPFLHFWGMVRHPAFLVIPTSAPATLIQGAFRPLAGWEWGYALLYTTLLIVGLAIWASKAFQTHIIMKGG